jgi:hypothetical protein
LLDFLTDTINLSSATMQRGIDSNTLKRKRNILRSSSSKQIQQDG